MRVYVPFSEFFALRLGSSGLPNVLANRIMYLLAGYHDLAQPL